MRRVVIEVGKMANPECILKVESTGFADGLMESIKKGRIKVTPGFLDTCRKMRLPWTETGEDLGKINFQEGDEIRIQFIHGTFEIPISYLSVCWE